MKKLVFAGMLFVWGCLAPVDPTKQPLGAGSRILGLSMNSTSAVREEYDATDVNVYPELGFLFSDNLALIFTPFFSLEKQEEAATWQAGGLLITGDYTFYTPGRNVHPFASGSVGFAAVSAEDKSVSPSISDDSQGFVVGAGGGLRMFHSSNCSVDMAVRWTLTTAKLDTMDVDPQNDVWVGVSVKLYFPLETTLRTR